MLGQIRSKLADRWSGSAARIITSRLTKPKPKAAEAKHGGNLVASVLKEQIFIMILSFESPLSLSYLYEK